MAKPKIGGYIFRQTINRALRANTAARRAVEQILDATDQRTHAIALTKITLALAENQEAIQEIVLIIHNQTPPVAAGGDEQNQDE